GFDSLSSHYGTPGRATRPGVSVIRSPHLLHCATPRTEDTAMIDLKRLNEELPSIQEKTAARSADFDFDQLTALSQQRREAIFQYETLRAEQKKASQGMRSLKPGSDEFNALRTQLKEMSTT